MGKRNGNTGVDGFDGSIIDSVGYDAMFCNTDVGAVFPEKDHGQKAGSIHGGACGIARASEITRASGFAGREKKRQEG